VLAESPQVIRLVEKAMKFDKTLAFCLDPLWHERTVMEPVHTMSGSASVADRY